MKYTVNYDKDACIVRTTLDGVMDSMVLDEFVDVVVDALNRNECKRLLNDGRKMQTELSTLEIVSIPKLLVDAGLDPNCKRALVVARIDEDIKFHETVTLNRNQRLGVFTDIEEAERWLLHGE